MNERCSCKSAADEEGVETANGGIEMLNALMPCYQTTRDRRSESK